MARALGSWVGSLLVLPLLRCWRCEGYTGYETRIVPRYPPGCRGITHPSCGSGPNFNDFGNDVVSLSCGDVEPLSCVPSWTTALCEKDTDGDLKTNGDELGDPCCVFQSNGGRNPAYIRDATDDISHPSERDDTTPKPSCTFDDPAVPGGGLVTSVDSGLVQARVNLGAYPSWDNTCVCFGRFEVYFELDSGESDRFTFSIGRDKSFFVLPLQGESMPVENATRIFVRPAFQNRKGISAQAPVTDFALAKDDPTIDTLPPSVGEGFTVTDAPAVEESTNWPLWVYLIVLVSVLVLGVLLHLLPPTNRLRAILTRPLFAPPKSGYEYLETFGSMSLTSVFVVGGISACIVYMVVHQYNELRDALTARRSIGFAIQHGTALALTTALLLTPRKMTLNPVAFGLGFERSLKYHIFFSLIAAYFTVVHFIIILIEELDQNFLWGIIAGAILWVAVLTGFMRVPAYAVFRQFHSLMPLAGIFIALHLDVGGDTWREDARNLSYLVLAATALVVLDYLYEAIMSVTYQRSQLDPSCPPRVVDGSVYLQIEKRGFVHRPGQWCSLFMPSISNISHPFSIVPVLDETTAAAHRKGEGEGFPPPTVDGRFALLVKVMDPKKRLGLYKAFTPALAEKVALLQDKQERAREGAGGLGGGEAKGVEMPFVAIGGPYGHSFEQKMKHYDAILFVAGGSGVTAVASVVATLNAQKVGCAYWSFRDAGMFDVMANHFRHIPTDKCGFFLTNKEATDSDLIALNGEGDARVQRGRGNLTDFLTQAAEKLQTSPHPPKHIGVFVCGPEAMAQEAWRFTQADGWCNGRMHLMLEVFRFG